MNKVDLATISDGELADVLKDLGAPPWRAQQIRDATWRSTLGAFSDLRQLPPVMRDALAARVEFSTVEVVLESDADDGNTVKLLCELGDGQTVEAVAMETPARGRSKRRATVCVSSQVGCAVGCPFCATGQMGLRRNCTASEIVDQFRVAARALTMRGLGPLTHVVFMGMGEPLANYDNVIAAIRILTAGPKLSARRITVSTSGLIPGIERLTQEGIPVTLAISLHAATDVLRDRLVPVNKKYPITRLKAAAKSYVNETGRRVTLEWCLIGNVNDSDDQATGLRAIAHELSAHVNVIPMNDIDGSDWGPPSKTRTARFMSGLEGVRHTIRDTRGSESDAACGQLRANLEQRRWVLPDGTLSRPTGRVGAN